MSCISSYQPPQSFPERFLQWLPVNYYLDSQEVPIEICPPGKDSCIYEFGEIDQYQLPIQKGDIISWIMDQSEIVVDGGTLITDLIIAITKNGVLFADNVGTVSEVSGSDQYYCTASIPCMDDSCDYQFVIYDKTQNAPLDCSIFACSTLQDLINSGLIFGDTVTCVPILEWGC